MKSDKYNTYSYTTYFQTKTEWETIDIIFSDLMPTFRGRSLDLGNYAGSELEELGFLVGNKKN